VMRGSLDILKSTPSRSFLCIQVNAPLFRVGNHGTELYAAENASFLTHTLGSVEDRAGRIQLDGDSDGQKQG